jgi:hypothetical protein
MTRTPVVLIIFRRPDLTARVLRAIAQARPSTLLVVADGPRPDRPDDERGCEAARAVIDRIDWDCEVIRRFSDVNLGCGRGPATGISWAFEQVDEAIILEDDCLPLPSFFRYCDEMLERYRDDQRVMHISGSTLRRHPVAISQSYFFSQFNVAAGSWATWRRAWRLFDATVRLWPSLRDTSWLHDRLGSEAAVRYWAHEFHVAYEREGDVSYWDHQWTFACWANSGLSVAPRTNLAANLGGGVDATHMTGTGDPILNVPVQDLAFPLVHPPTVLQSWSADREFLSELVLPRLAPPPSRARVLASRLVPASVRKEVRRALAARVRPALRTGASPLA